MDYSKPGFPVLHHLPEFAQTHVHWVSDAIQPSHPLSPPSPPALNLSSVSFPMSWLFASGGQSTGDSASALVLPVNIQGWFPLGLTVQWTLQDSSHSTSYSGGSLNLQNVYFKVQGMTNYNSFSWHFMVCFSYKLVEESSSSVQWYHLLTFQLA